MNAFAEFHDELRSVARQLLAEDGAVPWDTVARAGWPGLAVPEEFDGAGAGVAEAAVLLTEVGRAAARTALPSVLALSVPALLAVGADPLRDEVLRAVVAGRTVPVVVLSGDAPVAGPVESGSARPDSAPASRSDNEVESSGVAAPFRWERGLLTGTAHFVLDAPSADLLLIPVVDPDGGTVLAAVDPESVTRTPAPLVDATRTVGTVTADAVEPRAVWRFETPIALSARAALATACDSLGIAEAMLDATVAYVRVREQFGRPVGSFQAVKHACADMLVRVTVAGHLVAAAVDAVQNVAPDAETAVGMAKSYATEAAVSVAGAAMQLHGGYGYTWESGIHAHLKRATLNRALFGTPAAHRRTLAARYRE
ncbi:acyl-CoA dehydrogenase family protein [Nocardia sp. NPDC057353]|uniref:acyl-CoA dehydrogenase family protein n=1 Tax=Nocardia sp. NPDC057353 TaxID=3346104 RepID=UPI003641DDDA